MVIKYHVLHNLKVKIKRYRVIQDLIIHTQQTQNTKNIYNIIQYVQYVSWNNIEKKYGIVFIKFT